MGTIKIIMAVVEEAEDMEVIIITIKIMVTTTKIMVTIKIMIIRTKIMIITIEIIMIIIKGMVVMVMLQDGVMVIIKIMITTMGNPVVGINQENLLPLHLKVKTKITKKMTKKMNQNLDHGQNKMVAKVEMKSIFFFDKSLMTD